jgi:hypothetical protein
MPNDTSTFDKKKRKFVTPVKATARNAFLDNNPNALVALLQNPIDS